MSATTAEAALYLLGVLALTRVSMGGVALPAEPGI
jgi:hypothetical protein